MRILKLFLAAITLTTASFAGISAISSTEAEAASCITKGSTDGYGGLIINVRYRDYETGNFKPANNVDVRVSTHGNTKSPPGNVVQLNSGGRDGYGDYGVSKRVDSAVFSQKRLSYCNFNSVKPGANVPGADDTNVVLGDPFGGVTTSSGSNKGGPVWGIDCDTSRRGSGNYQPIKVGVHNHQTPSGARAMYSGAGSNYGWEDKVIENGTPNGDTTFITITYREPPPKDSAPEGRVALNCNRVGWRGVRDDDSPNGQTSVLLRIKQGGPNSGNPWIKIYESGSRKKGNDTFNRDSRWPVNARITAELRIRNITPNNQVNNNGAKVREKTVNCNEGAGILNCNRFVLNNSTRPNNWSSLNKNNKNLRILIWTANQPFGDSLHPGKYSGTESGWHYGITASEFPNFSPPMHTLSQGEGGYNLQRSGNVYAQMRVFQRDTNVGNNADPNDNWDNWHLRGTYRYSAEGNPCYQASCQVNVDIPPGSALPAAKAVKAGHPINISIVVTNTGGNVWGAPVQVRNEGANSNGWNFARDDDSGGIGPGGDAEFEYSDVSVSSTPAVNHMNVHPSFGWLDQVNSSPGVRSLCGNSVNVYQQFGMSVGTGTQLLPDNEDPDQARFTTTVTHLYGPSVSVTTSRSFLKNGSPISATSSYPNPGASTYPPSPGTITDTHGIANGSFKAGDIYCVISTINRASGWRGPGGVNDVLSASSDTSGPDCDRVKNNPYLRAYHTDVLAGGAFEGEGDCSAGGSIRSYLRGSGSSYSGSGAQFAAIAISAINGFTSASVRNAGAPTMPTGLTFANTTGGFGGGFGGINCATNFFDETQNKNEIIATSSPSVSGSVGQTISDNNVTLSGGTVNGKRAIYVDGDVYITGNITLGGGSDVEDLPNFSLIVRGNIYISPNVSRLDGLYVAQRNGSADSSRIYTCAPGFSTYTEAQLWSACGGPKGENNDSSGQLVVNGAFVAGQVHLLRTYKSLRDSSVRENYAGNAAEVFRLSPDTYLSIPAFKKTEDGIIGPADSAIVLPPIL